MAEHDRYSNKAFCRNEVVGCGPADILEYMDGVEYWSYDISEAYINFARKKYKNDGYFYCKYLRKEDLATLPQFNVVLVLGVLHHMDDDVALDFIELAKQALEPGGRLVTIDPCWVKNQNLIARFLIKSDRGENVRSQSGYQELAESVFDSVTSAVRNKTWIPYTHCFMECIRT